ncbi:caspase domain-containing protein [Trametes polyzona]|nr:caspase domain-containing protein [Trametes polyzona]
MSDSGSADIHPQSAHKRESVKKALLIGVGHTSKDAPRSSRYPALHHAVPDTRLLATLLISQYGYLQENVVVLVDGDASPQKATPTKANILRELARLTYDAHPGDHFFFYYAGHSDRDEPEDDSITSAHEGPGKDSRFLVPCDYWNHPEGASNIYRMIYARELRELLVGALPVGTDLYAVFDSCSSGRLLDLLHYNCNNIYVPWISPGYRRCMTWWRKVRRRDALDAGSIVERIDQAIERLPKGRKQGTKLGSKENCTTPPNSRRSSSSSIHIIQRTRVSQDEIRTTDTSVAVNVDRKGKRRQFSIQRRQSSVQRHPSQSTSLHQILEDPSASAGIEDTQASYGDIGATRCASPTEACDGFSCPSLQPFDGPNVITLAAAREKQRAWDSKDYSFTGALVSSLMQRPHPTFEQLTHDLTFRAFELCKSLHERCMVKREEWKRKLKGSAYYNVEMVLEASAFQEERRPMEMLNFFEPEVGSQRSRVLQDIFDP